MTNTDIIACRSCGFSYISGTAHHCVLDIDVYAPIRDAQEITRAEFDALRADVDALKSRIAASQSGWSGGSPIDGAAVRRGE